MINRQLLNPESIVVVGGSGDLSRPGGKILKNLIGGGFKGRLFSVNPAESGIDGVICFKNINDLPDVDLAIIAVHAGACIDLVDVLASKKNTKAFIVISAGFGELNADGKFIEDKITEIINKTGGVLIGPNCIGVLNRCYSGLFTEPVPVPDPAGVDLISASGATAVFIMENGISRGLKFANVFSVGNSAQTGVEEILKYMDENFIEGISPRIKLLYLENIRDPMMLLEHASSLVRRGCLIAAIKPGRSEAGSRAVQSHTGALAASDTGVDALFRKAGIIRCYGRDELVTTACIFHQRKAAGKNFAVITHAGGPGVMLTDVLAKNGLNVPLINNEYTDSLLKKLYPGSSVSNPVDFLATGTAAQLGAIMDFIEEKTDLIDAAVVIFGTPGLSKIYDVYDVLHDKILKSVKPVYPVLPSILTAADEIRHFRSRGNVYFPDEVLLGEALAKVYNAPGPFYSITEPSTLNRNIVRSIIGKSSDGFLPAPEVRGLLDACGIPAVEEYIAGNPEEALLAAGKLSYPLVIKGSGPVHKTESGAVSLNIGSAERLTCEFNRIIGIPGVDKVIIQPAISGIELFIGAKYEHPFGHLILCGTGGIFVEMINDFAAGLVPLCREEALYMIRSLKSYKVFKGVRGIEPVDENIFADIILKVNDLLLAAPEISEIDLNPLIAGKGSIVAVDARIKKR